MLTTSNVTNLTKYARLAVDNASSALGTYNPIYAQPLYVAGITANSTYQSNCNNLTINSQPACNMLIAVTAYDSFWAWNADKGTVIFSRTSLWTDRRANGSSGAGALNAYDAGNLNYLWSSNSLTNPPLFSNNYPAFNGIPPTSGLYALPTISNGNV